MNEKLEGIQMLFVLFSINFVKELKGSTIDKVLANKGMTNELLNMVGESISQTINDIFDKCNAEKTEGDRNDA